MNDVASETCSARVVDYINAQWELQRLRKTIDDSFVNYDLVAQTWTFQQAVNMQIGNPGGIILTVNGKRMGSPGSAGQPVTLSLGPGRPVSS